MKDLIEKMWNEEFRPAEKYFVYSEEIKRKQLFLDNYEEKLRELLNEKEEMVFEDFISVFFDMLDLERLDAFIGGIQFASKMFKGMFIE